MFSNINSSQIISNPLCDIHWLWAASRLTLDHQTISLFINCVIILQDITVHQRRNQRIFFCGYKQYYSLISWLCNNISTIIVLVCIPYKVKSRSRWKKLTIDEWSTSTVILIVWRHYGIMLVFSLKDTGTYNSKLRS